MVSSWATVYEVLRRILDVCRCLSISLVGTELQPVDQKAFFLCCEATAAIKQRLSSWSFAMQSASNYVSGDAEFGCSLAGIGLRVKLEPFNGL